MSTFSQSLETDRPMNRLTTRLLELLEAAKQVHSLNIPTKTNKKSVEKNEEKMQFLFTITTASYLRYVA